MGKRQVSGDRSRKKKKKNLAGNYLENLWQNYYTNGEGKGMKGRERRDGTKIEVDGTKIEVDGTLKEGPCYESPKKEIISCTFKTLNSQYQVIQQRQDINSVGT